MTLELRFTIPGQVERLVPLDQVNIKIGALLSNQVVLRAPGVDPIHALIEELDGDYIITDLGSATGVKINGRLIDVEQKLEIGDSITVGSVVLLVAEAKEEIIAGVPPMRSGAVPPPPSVSGEGEIKEAVGSHAPRVVSGSAVASTTAATVRVSPADEQSRRHVTAQPVAMNATVAGEGEEQARKKEMLFSPRKARPGGEVLETVAYWGDTVLDVELFHPTFKGFEKVTIGDPTKAHLIAAGKENFSSHTLAAVSSSGGFKLNLRPGMYARLRRGGKVEKVDKPGTVSLGARDIAHIKYGAVSYFLMYVKPPALNLPRTGPRDPLFLGLSAIAMLLYFILVPIAILHNPSPEKENQDDIWQIVQVPEKDERPKKPEPEKQPEVKKPEVKLAEKKTPPKVPPKPQPKPPVKPAKAVEKEKPKQTKPVEKPVPEKKPTEVLTASQTNKAPTPQKPQQAKPAGPSTPNPEKAPGPKSPNQNNANSLSNLKGVGMPSTGAKNPNFKLAGPTLKNTALGKSGGVVGSGMNQAGGARKGTGKADYKGVEGVNNNKASGVNLSKLGLGVGKIMNKTGAGAINTNFKNSAGGAGGGMGSASKTYGLGGVGSGKSLGLAGAGGAVNNFGSGSGGFLGGQGGTGGAGGAGLGGAFGGGAGGGAGGPGGHGRANVEVPPGDPVVSGGLTAQEIMAVIRANLNQIRHCYEQLLQRSPNAAGKMSVSFVVATTGRVQSVSVLNSSISDSRMRGCVTGKIQRWAFPKPRGGQAVTVNYPFVFNPL